MVYWCCVSTSIQSGNRIKRNVREDRDHGRGVRATRDGAREVVVRLTGGDFWCLESSADLSSSISLRPRAACVMSDEWSKL